MKLNLQRTQATAELVRAGLRIHEPQSRALYLDRTRARRHYGLGAERDRCLPYGLPRGSLIRK